MQKAEKLQPQLDYFIIATTGSRDTGEQAQVRYLQAERVQDQKFPVALWYWDDYIGFQNNDARLNKWYANQLRNLYGERLSDKQILSVMRVVFSRAEFRTPLEYESSGEFRPALLDTEGAVNTGLLLDRETRMPLCRAPGGLADITFDPDNCIQTISAAVQNARIAFDNGVVDGEIQERARGARLLFPDTATRIEIDRYRRDALIAMNDLLAKHGELPINSPLLT